MPPDLLILRPEPGTSRTQARAHALGLSSLLAPLFTIAPLAWRPPERSDIEAVMITSANAARLGGRGLRPYLHLPCYVVGAASAAAARGAGFDTVDVGPSDAQALVEMMERDGIRSALHLCGRERKTPAAQHMRIEAVPVYAAEAADRLPNAAINALRDGAVALLHSPRAARLFGEMVDTAALPRAAVAVAAISEAALAEAGSGWRLAEASRVPRDAPLLELAAALCQSGSTQGAGPEE